jgi:hypothetical protein
VGWRKAIAAVLCQDMSRALQTRYPSEVVKYMLLGTGVGWSSDGDEEAGSGDRESGYLDRDREMLMQGRPGGAG